MLAARVERSHVAEVLGPRTLAALFVLAVLLGSLGRVWHGPASLVDSAGRVGTAAIGAVAAVLVNNLPAAVLLAPSLPTHPRALLLGLNLGPNLAVTGSLSAFLWLRVARRLGARPSVAALLAARPRCRSRCRSPPRSRHSGSSRRGASS